MRVVKTAEFEKFFKNLPAKIRHFCRAQEELLALDWRDHRLHIKKLNLSEVIYSFRVTRSYRALFYFSTDGNIILFDIDNRKDVYR